MKRRTSFKLAAVAGSALLALVAAELGVRALGHGPFRAVEAVDLGNYFPPYMEFDPERGWRNPAGYETHAAVEWTPGRDWPGPITFLSDGSRRTRAILPHAGPSAVAVVGGSYTQGAGVADFDTFAWILQERFPSYDLVNHGTGGYGSYQSLLALESYFETQRKPTRLVIYGFGDYHGVRDRATASWLAWLKPRGSVRYFIPPHVALKGQGGLERYPGRYVAACELCPYSALANLTQEKWVANFSVAQDDPELTNEVLKRSILLLRGLSTRHGAEFLVAVLRWSDEGRRIFAPFFAEQRIEFADCQVEDLPFGHPDAFWNWRHADCIERTIRERELL